MSISDKCTMRNISGLPCDGDPIVWATRSDAPSEVFYTRCRIHDDLSCRLDMFHLFTSYNDAVVYEAMRQL